MNKKFTCIFIVFFISFLTLSSSHGITDDKNIVSVYSLDIPDDFNMLIYCGGISPMSDIFIMTIDSNGDAYYYIIDAEDRVTFNLTLISQFEFSNDEMNQIWDAIIVNDFFNLNTEYSRSWIYDGTFANITVTANGINHSVQTHNIDIFEFDNIVKIVNSFTPDDNDLIYNALLNNPPFKPGNITGASSVNPRYEQEFTTVGFDLDYDDIYFMFDWGDNTNSEWQGPFESGENVTFKHSWNKKGQYNIRVKSIDDPNSDGDLSDGSESDWSNPLSISISKNKVITKTIHMGILELIAKRFHYLKFLLDLLDISKPSYELSSINDDDYDPRSGTRGKIDGCKITIEIHIILYGAWVDSATPEQINATSGQIQADIESIWNRDQWDKKPPEGPDGEPPWRVQCKQDCDRHDPGCTVHFDAKVYKKKGATSGDLPDKGKAGNSDWEGYHWIYVAEAKSKYKSQIIGYDNNLPKPNDGSEYAGIFILNEYRGVYAHEAGHLMGRDDLQEDEEVEVPNPRGPGTIKVKKPKKVGNIMADPLNGWPDQEDIDEIVKDSGIECPCKCCPEGDTTNPENDITYPHEAGHVMGLVTVNGIASDDESGVAKIDYKLEWDGGSYNGDEYEVNPPLNYLEYSLGPINLDYYIEPGDWIKITTYAIDAAGNIGEDSVTVTLIEEEDTTPPVTEKIIGEPNEDGGYIIWPFTPITFEATDDMSGIKYIYYEVWWDSNEDGIVDMLMAEKTVYDNTVMFSVDMYGILINTIELRWYAVDNADNIEDMHYQQHYVTT